MGAWWVLALFSGLGLASRNILFKLAGDKMDAALGAMVLSVAMAVTAIAYFLYQRMSAAQAIGDISVPATSSGFPYMGVLLAALGGVGVALANILLAYTYQAGGPASMTAFLQNCCALSITLLLGMWVLQENIQPLQVLGIACAIVGIYLIIRGR